MKTALTNFASAVSQKAAGKDKQLGTEDDVDHRIAVVGFASDGGIEEYYYTNTELFVGAKQYRCDRNAKDQYKNAFQTMDTQIGQDNITASINALDADGGTHPDLGIKMANGILNANPVTSSDKARNRVVIMFTDGFPGDSSFDTTVADNAIKEAQITKNAGTTVYSVGIFGGADATNAGDRDSSNETVQANWFMQTVSSNNGEPQSPSYYLSASDADSLNNIFKQISDNIQSGGSSTTLNDTAVIRDIISTPFKLANEDVSSITLETYKYEGNDSSGAKKWTKNSGAMNATASVDGDKVNVTGFDYAANYVGTDTNADGTKAYHGDKLVISFNVVPKDGFLGGNDVYTNTSAGVYENADAATPVLTFNRPQVNVPIKDITVTARDKNVYLLNDLTKEQLLSDATVQVGHVSLDLTRSDYGLESWQTKYVNISVAVKDENGNAVTDLSALKEDQTYSVTVTVSPKTDGANASGAPAIEKTGNDGGTINVFKPELTYTDSTVYYGDIAPTDFSDNLKETIWKHEDEIADAEAMGAAPELSLSYTPDAAKITDGKIDSKKDVNIDAVVKIGHTDITTSTSFAHVKEAAECSWNITDPDGSPAFLLHVKTCQLTITKKNGASDEPYVFTVYKDGVKYSEVTIVGNRSETISELPVGIYTIEEDGGWSWRYSATYEGNGATLTAGNDSGSITCTNKKDSNSWLNNFSTVVKNIFGKANNKK
ncbi:MAG: VWA domain-containing protein [Clostridiales bacterium]|nr:VWA domain-containing protein [Clostridiales bacterium]